MSEIIWQMQETNVKIYACVPSYTRYFDAEFRTAASSIDAPVAYSHYEGVLLNYGNYDMTSQLSVSVSQQYAQGARISVTNNHPFIDIDLIYLALTGTLVQEGYTITKTAQDDTSVAEYGKRTLNLQTKLPLAEKDTYAMMRFALAFFKDPQAIVRMEYMGSDDTKLTQILERHISDRVNVICTRLGMNTQFHIEKEEHVIDEANIHTVIWTLGKALGARQIAIVGISKVGDGSVVGY